MAAVPFGILPTFDTSQCWLTFKQKVTQYFIANDINSDTDKSTVKRKAIVFSSLSDSAVKLLLNLLLPRKLEEVTYEELLNALDQHFTPKKLTFPEKSRFYSAVQYQEESHVQWAARLRGLAAFCEFKDLQEALLDRFVVGMLPGHEKDKLFTQDAKKLTFVKAVELAESLQCARHAAAAAAGVSKAVPDVTSSNDHEVLAITQRNNKTDKKCAVCGYTNHEQSKCRFANYKCKKCGRKGHLRRMCNIQKVQLLDSCDMDDEDIMSGNKSIILNITCKQGKPMSERIQVGGKLIEFQIDSGSGVSIISDKIFKQKFPHLTLTKHRKLLYSYTGSCLKILGVIRLPVVYLSSSHDLEFYVVSDNGPSLLGRDFIESFNL